MASEGERLKEEALDLLEEKRHACPPPDDINPKVMGAVFRVKYGFKPLGYVQSKRKKAHHRPIREWTFE